MSKRKNKESIPAPDHLSERAKNLWKQLVPERVDTVGRRTLLQSGLEALDRADECRLAIAREGLVSTTRTTGASHVHPLAKLERECRQLVLRIWSQLGLDIAVWHEDSDDDDDEDDLYEDDEEE